MNNLSNLRIFFFAFFKLLNFYPGIQLGYKEKFFCNKNDIHNLIIYF